MSSTQLRFTGDWGLTGGLLLGVVLAALMFWFYRRELRDRGGVSAWVLPGLRALAVFWLVLILTGPVLHHRKVVGELARLLLFIDGSMSMTVSDPDMDPGRKLLIARQRGWLSEGGLETPDARPAEAVSEVREEIRKLADLEGDALVAGLEALVSRSREAAKVLDGRAVPSTGPDWSGERFREVVTLVIEKTVERLNPRRPGNTIVALRALDPELEQWRQQLEDEALAGLRLQARERGGATGGALERLDGESRLERVAAGLMEGGEGLLDALSHEHEVTLLKLNGGEAESLWTPRSGELPPDLGARLRPPEGAGSEGTDLSSAVRNRLEAESGEGRVAVVLFTDAQHNAGTSPLQLARILGNRNIPVFTVGMGTRRPVPDLAVLGVEMPDTVFFEARAKGVIQLKDDMPAGSPFTVRIQHEGRTVWERGLVTGEVSPREVDFDFPIRELVAATLRSGARDLRYNAVPLEFEVLVEKVEGERQVANNNRAFRFQAITEKPRVLLIDGRPRWEHRYLRNLFERDDRWALNVLLAGAGGELKPWARGNAPGQFPADRTTLFSYQLIVFGDVPPAAFYAQDLEWIRQFVELQGGGVLFVDGRRNGLAAYEGTALRSLFPVRWTGPGLEGGDLEMRLRASGTSADALSLGGDPRENREIWSGLPAPRWVARTEALPGTETLIEVGRGDVTTPAAVFRRYGAGRVLYMGFEESWRWRYRLGDLHHQKFWNQASKWIMEAAYPVQDRYVSLDTGPLTHAPGAPVSIRSRLRDASGRLLLKASAQAVVMKDGQRHVTVDLTADEHSGGVFRGRTPPLPEGRYEVRVRVDGIPESETPAHTTFVVEAAGGGEMARLNLNEDLARQMASLSGGRYFREENLGELRRQLEPLSQGRVIESETLLWQSWWWFIPLILLLTLEWLWRKRIGLL